MSVQVTITESDYQEAREQLLRSSEEYLQEIEDCAEEGFGAPCCFHGTNLWVDYDPICGYCEDDMYDPRRHSIDSEPFKDAVEIMANTIARKNRYNLLIEMIQEDAKNIESQYDLRTIQVKINAALEL